MTTNQPTPEPTSDDKALAEREGVALQDVDGRVDLFVGGKRRYTVYIEKPHAARFVAAVNAAIAQHTGPLRERIATMDALRQKELEAQQRDENAYRERIAALERERETLMTTRRDCHLAVNKSPVMIRTHYFIGDDPRWPQGREVGIVERIDMLVDALTSARADLAAKEAERKADFESYRAALKGNSATLTRIEATEKARADKAEADLAAAVRLLRESRDWMSDDGCDCGQPGFDIPCVLCRVSEFVLARPDVAAVGRGGCPHGKPYPAECPDCKAAFIKGIDAAVGREGHAPAEKPSEPQAHPLLAWFAADIEAVIAKYMRPPAPAEPVSDPTSGIPPKWLSDFANKQRRKRGEPPIPEPPPSPGEQRHEFVNVGCACGKCHFNISPREGIAYEMCGLPASAPVHAVAETHTYTGTAKLCYRVTGGVICNLPKDDPVHAVEPPAQVQSRSYLKRRAAMEGRPMPTFGPEPPAPECAHVWSRRRDGSACNRCGTVRFGEFK